MRIALLATHFADYSLELALELAETHQVLLLADREKLAGECAPERVAEAGRRLNLSLFSQNRRDRRLLADLWARRQLSRFRPDAVIAHEHIHPHVTRIQGHAARISKLLLIVHDPEPHEGRDAALAAAHQRQRQAQRGQAHHYFVHGAYCLSRLKAAMGEAKPISSIPHGPIMRPLAVTPPPGGRRALMFGRMEAYKGLDLLLEAYQRLAAAGVPAPLHLAGQGPELDLLEAAFAALPGCTIEKGYISRERVIEAMQAADLIVAPYREATQSGVMAAAFANARPMLATRVGGLPDFVRDGANGELVTPDDAGALATALEAWPAQGHELWRGALASAEGEMHWRVAAQAFAEAAR